MKNKNIVYILYMFIIVCNLLYKSNKIFYYAYGISVVIFDIYIVLYNNFKLRINRNIKSIFILILVFYFYCIMGIFLNPKDAFEIIKNSSILLIYFIAIIEMATFVSYHNENIKMLKTTYIALGLPVVCRFFINYKKIDYISSILNLFNTSTRERYSFGIGTTNDTGLIAVTIIILSLFLIKQLRNQKNVNKIWYVIIIIIDIICVFISIAAASRNAILSIIIFGSSYILFREKKNCRITNKYSMKFILLAILGIITLKILESYYRVTNIFQLMNYSGRMIAFYNLRYVYNQNKIWFGLGNTSKTFRIYQMLDLNHCFAVDSSYIYYLVQTGIIGFLIFSLILIIMGLKIFKSKCFDNRYKNMIISLYITFLFTGLFETTLLYAGMTIGIIFNTTIFEYICSSNKKIEDNIKEDGDKR